MEDKVVAESVHGGGGGEATIRKIKDGAEGVAQAGGGGVEEVREQVASLAEPAALAIVRLAPIATGSVFGVSRLIRPTRFIIPGEGRRSDTHGIKGWGARWINVGLNLD